MCHDHLVRVFALSAFTCMLLYLAGCASEQQRPVPDSVPNGKGPAARSGPTFIPHAVAMRSRVPSAAKARLPRAAPALAPLATVAANRMYTPAPAIAPRRAPVSAVLVDDLPKPLFPRALALRTISLKENRQSPEFDNPRTLRTPGDTEAVAVRYAGGPCPVTIYRIAWSTAQLFDIEPVVVAALIEIESGCRIDAVSTAGARGLMQLMPAFGARDGYRFVYGVDRQPSANELGDPAVNIRLGVAYLGSLRDHYAYVDSPRSRLLLAVAAYNCGPGFLDRRLPAESGRWKAEEAALWIAGHVPDETRAFVVAVLERASHYQSAIVATRTDAAVRLRRVREIPLRNGQVPDCAFCIGSQYSNR